METYNRRQNLRTACGEGKMDAELMQIVIGDHKPGTMGMQIALETALQAALKAGHVDVAKWVVSYFEAAKLPFGVDPDHMRSALEGGIETTEWYYAASGYKDQWADSIIGDVAAVAPVDAVQWFLEQAHVENPNYSVYFHRACINGADQERAYWYQQKAEDMSQEICFATVLASVKMKKRGNQETIGWLEKMVMLEKQR